MQGSDRRGAAMLPLPNRETHNAPKRVPQRQPPGKHQDPRGWDHQVHSEDVSMQICMM